MRILLLHGGAVLDDAQAFAAAEQQARARGAHKRGYTMDALNDAAKVDQIESVIRPYVQALQ